MIQPPHVALRLRSALTTASLLAFGAPSLHHLHCTALNASHRHKGDYGFNVFHNSNPQHGGSYARHERRMRDDEVEDFMKSVKGWTLVRDIAADTAEAEVEEMKEEAKVRGRVGVETPAATKATASSTSRSASAKVDAKSSEPPVASPLKLGEEAIQRTFHFTSFSEAYLFMGRFWAFCYGSDKYPPVTWDGCDVTVYLYSPSFHGLSKREARVAAFLNDQFNMLKKSRVQQEKILDGVVRQATVEELLGEEVRKQLEEREVARRAPLREASAGGPVDWAELLARSAVRDGAMAKKGGGG